MFKRHNPETVSEPVAAYSHGIEIAGSSRLMYVSGQIPQRRDGTIPETIEDQTEVVWKNITSVLASAGMRLTDICKINTYLTRRENLAPVRDVRARHLREHRPASTTVIVNGLAWPEFLLEVEVVAAKRAPVKRLPPTGEKARPRKAAKRAARKIRR